VLRRPRNDDWFFFIDWAVWGFVHLAVLIVGTGLLVLLVLYIIRRRRKRKP
jgi:LPXTG-motif cell wall-anchored protein